MAELAQITDPRPQRALQRAHRALEAELLAMMRPERVTQILEAALEKVVSDECDDPARRLRAVVGARLLDEVADLLVRVGDQIRTDETPTVAQPLEGVEPVQRAASSELPREITGSRITASHLADRWSFDNVMTQQTG